MLHPELIAAICHIDSNWPGIRNGASELTEQDKYLFGLAVEKKKELTFEFAAWETDSVEVEVRLLPNHPVEGERLRFTISLDGSATEAVSYETKGRSEEWKENV